MKKLIVVLALLLGFTFISKAEHKVIYYENYDFNTGKVAFDAYMLYPDQLPIQYTWETLYGYAYVEYNHPIQAYIHFTLAGEYKIRYDATYADGSTVTMFLSGMITNKGGGGIGGPIGNEPIE